MPRKHRREEHEPLTLTPADIRPQRPPRQPATQARQRGVSTAELKARRRKRIMDAIKWDECCVPGCATPLKPPHERDIDQRLPICTPHAVVIKLQIAPDWNEPEVLAARVERQKHRDQVADGWDRALTIRDNGGSNRGQIYILRLNGLIKVGWSTDLMKRLKAYGPDVEVLCHYPASREDETLMHRQLRPYLARGREWYQDCQLLADVVTGIVERHGEPFLSASWTEPKPAVVKPRRWSA